VTLVFDDDIQVIEGTSANLIQVTNDRGDHFEQGQTQVQGAMVNISLLPIPPGLYTVAYRVVSADGHPVSSEYSFEVASNPVASDNGNQPHDVATRAPRESSTASATPASKAQVKIANPKDSRPPNRTENAPWFWFMGGLVALASLVLAVRRVSKLSLFKPNR
jgi:hypothetical protein